MIRIDQAQRAAFRAEQQLQFERRVCTHLRIHCPEQWSDDALLQFIHRGIAEAAAHGIRREYDVRRFLEHAAARDGELLDVPEIAAILMNTQLDATQKLDLLDEHECFIDPLVRLRRPLNAALVRAANTELTRKFPELAHRQLSPDGPADEHYRQYWRECYLRNGGEQEAVKSEGPEVIHDVASDVHECPLAPKHIPVILLPGIMGSRLFFPDIQQFWDPDDTGAMLYWAYRGCETVRRGLHHEAPAQVMTTKFLEIEHLDFWGNPQWKPVPAAKRGWRGWESVTSEFYGKMLKALDDYANYSPPGIVCHAYAIGYDFRQSNVHSGALVATRIREILREESAEEFILVTHSMGGLVARSLLQSNSDLESKAKHIIHIMQPAWGAPVFVYALFRGFPYGGMIESSLGKALGDTGEEFMTVASGQRGAAELLPNNAYEEQGVDSYWKSNGWLRHRTSGDPDFVHGKEGSVYDIYLLDAMDQPGLLWMAKCIDTKRSSESVSVAVEMKARIGEARVFHERLREFSAKAITSVIYGTGLATCVGVDFTFDRKEHEAFEKYNMYGLEDRPGIAERISDAGDNTVPAVSAMGQQLGSTWAISTGIGHKGGCNESKLIDSVKRNLCKILKGQKCQ